MSRVKKIEAKGKSIQQTSVRVISSNFVTLVWKREDKSISVIYGNIGGLFVKVEFANDTWNKFQQYPRKKIQNPKNQTTDRSKTFHSVSVKLSEWPVYRTVSVSE